jgi:hypothetical protein
MHARLFASIALACLAIVGVSGVSARPPRLSAFAQSAPPTVGKTDPAKEARLAWFRDALRRWGFEIVRETRCINAITPRLGSMLKHGAYNSETMVRLDSLLTRALSWNQCYHAENLLDRLRPWVVAYVVRKP